MSQALRPEPDYAIHVNAREEAMKLTTVRSSRPSSTLILSVALLAGAVACDDSPAQPGARGNLMVDVTTVQFGDTDPILGSIEAPMVSISNQGTGDLMINELSVLGPDAGAFSIENGGAAPFTLAPGGNRSVTLGFSPTSEGASSASLRISSDDPMNSEVSVALSGVSVRFEYEQVDRMGIPALNTVFNHPSGTAGFDKTAYNVASPASDLADYRDQFIVVLDAVGNGDSQATADLLLLDELPVNMGAPTAFGALTGRAPADDATDVALTVTVGVPALQSDNVPVNDKPFLAGFPFLAAPH